MTSFFVASGGGGDALASAIVHAAGAVPGDSAVIATYAWDRLLVDPLPGPRGFTNFVGLDQLSTLTYAVTESTRPVAPAGSTLPRLAGEITPIVVLMDPYGGARGLGAQLADAVAWFGADRVQVVDVGGDILARGDEPTLRSPLADTLALAACAELPVPVDVLVAGLGLDAELDEGYVLERLGPGAELYVTVRSEHVEPFGSTFRWHPSEATAMLAAAARGARGSVEVRDAGTAVALSDTTAEVFRVPQQQVVEASPLARLMRGTGSFAEVEDAVRRVCGFCEMDYERAKAKRLGEEPPRVLTLEEFDVRLAEFEDQARQRGADYVSFRRVAEAVGRPGGGYEAMRRHMIDRWPDRYVWPIWALAGRHAGGDALG